MNTQLYFNTENKNYLIKIYKLKHQNVLNLFSVKPIIQKLPLNADCSFVAKTFKTPYFEVPWHQHIEYELILFTEGSGLCFIGNYVDEFKAGDIFFIGNNVPHTFQKMESGQIASAVVIQFTDDFWGTGFLTMPESNSLRELLAISRKCIRFDEPTKTSLGQLIIQLEHAAGFSRFSTLCNCLQIMIDEKHKPTLSTMPMTLQNNKYKQRLDHVFQHTITNFQQPVSLAEIAKIANMSITAFCAYFKKITKKSYIEFLNEIRIGYACTLLQDTDKTIIDVCYESGFNTPVNFNKQFLKTKKTTPSKFRNAFNKQFG